MLSRQEFSKIFYSNISTKTLFWIRARTYLITFLSGLKYLLTNKTAPLPSVSKPCLLFFSTDEYIDLKDLGEFELLVYKEKVSRGLRIDFKKEETLMALSFLMPYFIKKMLYARVYSSIERKLKNYDIRFFLCNNPELLNYPIAFYLKSRGICSGTIQHGVYSLDDYRPNYYEMEVAEYVFVWGGKYKESFNKEGIPAARLRVICPPFYFELQQKDFNSPRPIFLGQQLYKLTPLVTVPYNKMIEGLADYYAQKGIRLSYKPHPRENLKESLLPATLSKIELLSKPSVTPDFYSQYTHAFSVASTALIKALCSGLVCYQVDPGVDLPDFPFPKYTRIVKIYQGTIKEELDKPVSQITEQDIDLDFLFMNPSFAHENARILKECVKESTPVLYA